METNNTNIITTANGSNHIADGPLTTTAIRQASPDLLVNEIDSRVVRIRPMATPVDQISRMIGARQANSMVVDYYSVDTRPVGTTITDVVDMPKYNPALETFDPMIVKTPCNSIFSPTDTVLLPHVANGAGQPLMCYVVDVKPTEGISLLPINLDPNDDIQIDDSGVDIIRMGRAAAELDVQTAQFQALPRKQQNFCQIFKTQVEQSTFARLADKEVGWSFSDQEEVAIMDMRMGMEKSFIFGAKSRLTDPVKHDEVLFTGGIWNQAASSFSFGKKLITQDRLIELLKYTFTAERAGSPRKILIAGSDLIEAISRIDYTKVVMASETTTRWGIDFNEIRSKFGSLYVIHSEIFDQCGHPADGLIIDPQYMTKYTHVPFRVEHLDLKSSGQRNTDALVATEASCLVLRHPSTHIKVFS